MSDCPLFEQAAKRDVTVADLHHVLCLKCSHYWADGNTCIASPKELYEAELRAKVRSAAT